MKMMLFYILIPCLSLFSISCAENEVADLNSAKGAFQRGERLAKSERYEEAISYFHQVKNKYPYSKYAIASELKVANIQFDRERFIEAETDYRLFKEFHPTHAEIDFVTFRLGLSYFKQLPDSIDRDLSIANKALLYFNEVINSYGSSQYLTEAKKYKAEALKKLAGKEEYIANFYFIRKKYESALGRYVSLLNKYPNIGFNKQALFGATVSAYRDKNYAAARKYFRKLAATFPNSSEKTAAEKELSRGGQ
ncbi:outer membrane protein assembly factor BamD [Bdellovibrionales bacterium]|nr:outer membrane protein assembly factor BamD [Bdellovibrionales bacterium]